MQAAAAMRSRLSLFLCAVVHQPGPSDRRVCDCTRQHPRRDARQDRGSLVAVVCAAATARHALALRRAVESAHPAVVGPNPPLERAEDQHGGAVGQEGAEQRSATVWREAERSGRDTSQLLT